MRAASCKSCKRWFVSIRELWLIQTDALSDLTRLRHSTRKYTRLINAMRASVFLPSTPEFWGNLFFFYQRRIACDILRASPLPVFPVSVKFIG